LHIDYKELHIETEKRFYKKMNPTKTFLITLLIVGFGLSLLYMQYWSSEQLSAIGLYLWSLIVGILFVSETLIGYSIFEYERKKYIGK
jgi:hypothetical protein